MSGGVRRYVGGGVRRVCWWRGEWRGEEGMLVEG